jgi:hypothetical protein
MTELVDDATARREPTRHSYGLSYKATAGRDQYENVTVSIFKSESVLPDETDEEGWARLEQWVEDHFSQKLSEAQDAFAS